MQYHLIEYLIGREQHPATWLLSKQEREAGVKPKPWYESIEVNRGNQAYTEAFQEWKAAEEALVGRPVDILNSWPVHKDTCIADWTPSQKGVSIAIIQIPN